MQPERPEREGGIAKWRQETIASLLKPLALRIAECSSIYRTVCKAGAFCPKGRTEIYMHFFLSSSLCMGLHPTHKNSDFLLKNNCPSLMRGIERATQR